MKALLAISVAGALAARAPALAQDAGSPGAVGTGGGLTGSNTGSSYAPNGSMGDRFDVMPARRRPYGDLNEGRAAARNFDPYPTHGSVPAASGPEYVGPGSVGDSPTGGHDVSR